jgi:accessory gene regulator B
MEKYLRLIGKFLSLYSAYTEDTIVFCLKLWISTILQMIVLFILSMLLFDIWLFVSFVIVFCSLRIMIWGYHCKTFKNCFLVTTFLFLLVGFLSLFALKCEVIANIGTVINFVAILYLMVISIKDNTDKIKNNKRELIFFVIRIALVIIYGGGSEIMLLINNCKTYTYTWNIIFTYCIVFILTLIRVGGEKNEKMDN